MRDRLHLLKRQIHVCRLLRAEHGWTWWKAWQMSRVHQRHMLSILAELQADEQERAEFAASVREGIDHIDLLTLNGAI